jgi:Ca2+-binding RTX toxin-like protein
VYTLGGNLENLAFTGSGDFTGTGNALDNVITGDAGNDTLNGGDGSDTLIGGDGNDILNGGAAMYGGPGDDVYMVDNVSDLVSENANAGVDTVYTTVASYVLGNNLENLIFTGSRNFHGTGNALDNVLMGGPGSDTLQGGLGRDFLTGGAGADYFVFEPSVTQGDVITDFKTHTTGGNHDWLDLSAYDPVSLSTSPFPGGTLVTVDDANGSSGLIELQGVQAADFDNSDYFF